MKSDNDTFSIHNNKIYSAYEEKVANYLKEKYLNRTNEMSQIPSPQNTFYTKYGKRALDLIICIPLFVSLLPVYAIISFGVFIDVGTPIFYKQTRVGLNGNYFDIYKFRSMNDNRDSGGELLPPGKRVTRFGKFIRKFSLDELVEIWNIIKGDMSIIGPRPLAVFFVDRMSERHKLRHALRPGLECPRVIELDYKDTCKYQRTFENDIWYVEHVSFFQDIKMFWLLVKMVLSFKRRGEQAEVRGVSYFIGYDDEGHAMSMNKFNEVMREKVNI